MKKSTITVLLIEPLKAPRAVEIPAELSAYQNAVGGTVEAIYPFEDAAALICCDEGKLLGMPLNRPLFDEDGKLYDVIAGLSEDDFASLPPELIEKYTAMFGSILIL